jgi:hypothetical protein
MGRQVRGFVDSFQEMGAAKFGYIRAGHRKRRKAVLRKRKGPGFRSNKQVGEKEKTQLTSWVDFLYLSPMFVQK